MKSCLGRQVSKYIYEGRGDTLAQRAVSLLHHKSRKYRRLMGTWRATGSIACIDTWPQNLA
eukprot:1154086-Pelagomonas_calceolata.AAC.1